MNRGIPRFALALGTSVFVNLAFLTWLARGLVSDGEEIDKLADNRPLPLALLVPSESEEESPKPTLPKKKEFAYVRTTANQEIEKTDQAIFISDRNTAMRSSEEAAEEGDPNFVNIDGIEIKTREVEDREYQEAPLGEEQPSQAETSPSSPSPPQQQPEKQTEVAKEEQEHNPDIFNESVAEKMEDSKPNDAPKEEILRSLTDASVPSESRSNKIVELETQKEVLTEPTTIPPSPPVTVPRPPSVPSSVAVPSTVPVQEPPKEKTFQPQTRRQRFRGTLSSEGSRSLSAEKTPMGQYLKQVNQAVEQRWHYNCNRFGVTLGDLQIRFLVDKTGKPEKLEVVRSNASARVADFTLRSVLEAKIPPMPSAVSEILDDGKLEITYDVLIY